MRSNLYVRRDPFTEFDTLIRRAFGPVEGAESAERVDFSPAAEAHRDGDDAVIRLELPGLDIARDVTVEVLGRDLVVSGERRDERTEETEGRRLREIRYGSFRRTFGLGRPVNPEAVTASYDAGVLTVRIGGAYAEIAGQKIEISTATPVAIEHDVVEGQAEEPTES
jgi:HSP20 family protein